MDPVATSPVVQSSKSCHKTRPADNCNQSNEHGQQTGGGGGQPNGLSDLLTPDFLTGDCAVGTEGFGSACDSPAEGAPVDLSTLDSIALDFPPLTHGDIKQEVPSSSSSDEKKAKAVVKSDNCKFSERGAYSRYYFDGGGGDGNKNISVAISSGGKARKDQSSSTYRNRFPGPGSSGSSNSFPYHFPPTYSSYLQHPHDRDACLNQASHHYHNNQQQLHHQLYVNTPDYNSYHVGSHNNNSLPILLSPTTSNRKVSPGESSTSANSVEISTRHSPGQNSSFDPIRHSSPVTTHASSVSNSCRYSNVNSTESKMVFAERLLQQCLVPVQATKQGHTESLFRCKLCQKTEHTSKLLVHASHCHNINDLAGATKKCFSPVATPPGEGGQPQQSLEPDPSLGSDSSYRQMHSPPWGEGAFPSDLEDVAISPKNHSNQPSPFNNTGNVFADPSGNSNTGQHNQSSSSFLGAGAGGGGGNADTSTSSCSPPSVGSGDLTSLNPQDHFDPDFDVVDEMKFIDCLIQTMPGSGGGGGGTSSQTTEGSDVNADTNVDDDGKNTADNTSDSEQHILPTPTVPPSNPPPQGGSGGGEGAASVYQPLQPPAIYQPQHHTPVAAAAAAAAVTAHKFMFPPGEWRVTMPTHPSSNQAGHPPPFEAYGGSHHHPHHHHLQSMPTVQAQPRPPPPPQQPPPQLPMTPQQPVQQPTPSSSGAGKKKSPHFRWRRRKRRSKAQYPEMGQYLVPIDEGDEIQHLGRTLECTLCGLRGKRCHLTLHFKAKHSEVIDLNLHRNGIAPQPPIAPPPPPPPPEASMDPASSSTSKQRYNTNSSNRKRKQDHKYPHYPQTPQIITSASSTSYPHHQQHKGHLSNSSSQLPNASTNRLVNDGTSDHHTTTSTPHNAHGLPKHRKDLVSNSSSSSTASHLKDVTSCSYIKSLHDNGGGLQPHQQQPPK